MSSTEETIQPINDDAIYVRRPEIHDGAAIWQLVSDSGVLDVNSAYLYIILCAHFSETCIVAEQSGQLVGFVTGYRLPDDPGRLFIWQVGTAESMRGKGIATQLLLELFSRESLADVNHILATISPSNAASETLFTRLASRLGAKAEFSDYITSDMFPVDGHEDERLLTIGPFADGLSSALKNSLKNKRHDGNKKITIINEVS